MQPSSETSKPERMQDSGATVPTKTGDLPTAGEWVRGLIAKGFVPVSVKAEFRKRPQSSQPQKV